jgi:hypothetical protein
MENTVISQTHEHNYGTVTRSVQYRGFFRRKVYIEVHYFDTGYRVIFHSVNRTKCNQSPNYQ